MTHSGHGGLNFLEWRCSPSDLEIHLRCDGERRCRIVGIRAGTSGVAKAWLPTLRIEGAEDPIVHVETANGEHVYSLRIRGTRFSPKVFAHGQYKVTVEDAQTGKTVSVTVKSQAEAGGEMRVGL